MQGPNLPLCTMAPSNLTPEVIRQIDKLLSLVTRVDETDGGVKLSEVRERSTGLGFPDLCSMKAKDIMARVKFVSELRNSGRYSYAKIILDDGVHLHLERSSVEDCP